MLERHATADDPSTFALPGTSGPPPPPPSPPYAEIDVSVVLQIDLGDIAMRFTEDYFAKQYKQTIGLVFFIKRMVLPGVVRPAPPRP